MLHKLSFSKALRQDGMLSPEMINNQEKIWYERGIASSQKFTPSKRGASPEIGRRMKERYNPQISQITQIIYFICFFCENLCHLWIKY